MKTLTNVLMIAALIVPLYGCGGSDSDLYEEVVYNETVNIKENEYLTVTLPSARYRAEITSSNNGVVVSWIGGNYCTTSAETKAYSMTCQLDIKGQLIVKNPSLLSLGGIEVVTVKVIKYN